MGIDTAVLREKTMETKEILEAIGTLVTFARQNQPTSAATGELGFCEPPRGGAPLYIDDEEGFYEFDESKPKKEQKQHKEQKAIKCVVKGLKISTKTYEGKENQKLRVDLQADQMWMLEKGLATNFTKDLLNCLALLGADIKNPITIEISIPKDQEKKTCFCRVYNSQDMLVQYERGGSYNPHKLIEQIQAHL